MRVALTGASGFVGGAVARELAEHGHALRTCSRSEADPTASTVRGDLRTSAVRERLVEDVDVVVHCAAALRTSDDSLLSEMNVHVTSELARCARLAGVSRFILLSSTGVYGQAGGDRDEASPHMPGNAYEQTKSAGEVAAAAELGADSLVIVRPSNVVGPSQRRPLLRLLRRLHGPMAYGASAYSNYVSVRDVAAVVVRCLDADAPPAIVVNDPLPLATFIGLGRTAMGLPQRRDWIIPSFASQVVAAAVEPQRYRHTAFSRGLALLDDTRFSSIHRVWARGQVTPEEASANLMEQLVSLYRKERLL